MDIFKTGDSVIVNVCALYNRFGEHLRNTEIALVPKPHMADEIDSGYWYDLNFHGSGELACFDGEDCVIANIDRAGNITLRNENADDDVCFTLSKEEAKIAICF